MPKYKIQYYFEGNGEVEIEAVSPEEAKERFYDGEFTGEKEWGENYVLNRLDEKDLEHCEHRWASHEVGNEKVKFCLECQATMDSDGGIIE